MHLNHPSGEKVVRDIVDTVWEEPEGIADQTLGDGQFSLPGLVDSHAHFAAPIGEDWQTDPYEKTVERASKALAAGVLLAFDKGWSNLNTVRLLDEVPPGDRPEIEAAGVINAVPEGYWPDFARELTDETFDDGIDQSIEEGRGWVKLIGDWPRRGRGPVANFSESRLADVVTRATASGARVAIHTMARDVPGAAVRAGVHSIEHGLFLTEDDLADLGARGGMWVPTIIRMEAVVDQLGAESTGGRLILEGLANVRRLMPLAAEAGVLLLAGTDVTVGAHDVALEAQKMVSYGLPAENALRAVSGDGYRAAHRDDPFAVGSPADVVIFDVNPIEELGALSHPAKVVRLGRVVQA